MKLAQGSRQQQGGVLAEFVVVTGFIIMPLIMLLPVLFSYIESRQLWPPGP